MKKDIVMYSGGIGSWAAAKRIAVCNGTANLILLFSDTFAEDDDLYRFVIETAADFQGRPRPDLLIARCKSIPPITELEARKDYLRRIAADAMAAIPNLNWIAEGRSPWEVFYDARFIGNSRIAPCSYYLKQKIAREWIKENMDPEECTLYLGIDWSESQRTFAPVENWKPYAVQYPMTEAPFLSKEDMCQWVESFGIERPDLYKEGFSHNNCGGGCVRGGQKHWLHLLASRPDMYAFHEAEEQKMREYLQRDDVSILTRTVNKVKQSLPLKQLREEQEAKAAGPAA